MTTLEQEDAEQLAFHQREAHAGCFTLAEVAAQLHLTKEAVRRKCERHRIGHRDPSWQGRKPRLHLTLADIAEAYPGSVRIRPPSRRRYVRVQPWNRAERAILSGNHRTIGPGTPERDAAVERMRERTP